MVFIELVNYWIKIPFLWIEISQKSLKRIVYEVFQYGLLRFQTHNPLFKRKIPLYLLKVSMLYVQ
ncbi:hypothetical protein EIP43_00840 [Listeria monocytogenes]|nr:hypothetical protein [Listeria monocytogenes]